MRLRIYREGKPDWTDEGPGYARVSGYGGSAVGHTIISSTPSPVPSLSVRKTGGARKPDAKRSGHHDSHRTARYLDSMTIAGRAS